MSLGKMIRQARERKGLSQTELSKRIGVSDKTISSWESERTQPNEDGLKKLMKALQVDANYLLSADTDSLMAFSQEEIGMIWKTRKLLDWEKDLVDAVMDRLIDARSSADQDVQYIAKPYFYARPSAGSGNDVFDGQSEIRVKESRISQRADFILQVDGDSMSPRFSDGDFVGVRKTDVIDDGDIGIFVVDGDVYIKQALPDTLHSLNPEFPDVPLNENSDVRCFGKVLGKVEI